MKSLLNWRLFILLVSLTLIMGCSDSENNSDQKVDGVNVSTGRRITEISVLYDNFDLPSVFNVEYDSKGRLSRIKYKEIGFSYDYDSNHYSYTYNFYYTGNYINVLSLDYDLRYITYSQSSSSSNSYGFFLNEDGYVFQLGPCTMTYNNGYLVGTETPKAIGQLIYDSNELIKASVSNLKKGTISLCYINYDNIENQGELIVNIQCSDDHDNNLSFPEISAIIAYECGLFGKVSKSFVHLKSEKELLSLFNYSNNKKSKSFRLKFKSE